MGQVKKWQKVTIGILVAALIAVVASIITRNVDTTAANNQAGYTEQAETQTRDYDAELAEEVTVPETSQAQKVPTAKEIANELYKQFEKNYGKAYQKNTANNSFFNPKYTVSGEGVQIAPYHVWYQDGKMYADCYVINANPVTVTNINVEDFELANENGVIADYSFGLLPGTTLAPNEYTSYTFIFPKGTFEKANLTNMIDSQSETTWDYY